MRWEFTWVTGLPLDPDHASELARAARSRWKIENEMFNTLKNVQYLEHNSPDTESSTCTAHALGFYTAYIAYDTCPDDRPPPEMDQPIIGTSRGPMSP